MVKPSRVGRQFAHGTGRDRCAAGDRATDAIHGGTAREQRTSSVTPPARATPRQRTGPTEFHDTATSAKPSGSPRTGCRALYAASLTDRRATRPSTSGGHGCSPASSPRRFGTPFASRRSTSMPIDLIRAAGAIAAATVAPLRLTLPAYPAGHSRAPDGRHAGSTAGRPMLATRSVRHFPVASRRASVRTRSRAAGGTSRGCGSRRANEPPEITSSGARIRSSSTSKSDWRGDTEQPRYLTLTETAGAPRPCRRTATAAGSCPFRTGPVRRRSRDAHPPPAPD